MFRARFITNAIQLCIDANVDSNVSALGPYKLSQLKIWYVSLCMHVKIYFFDKSDGNAECFKHFDSHGNPLGAHIFILLWRVATLLPL